MNNCDNKKNHIQHESFENIDDWNDGIIIIIITNNSSTEIVYKFWKFSEWTFLGWKHILVCIFLKNGYHFIF